MQVQSGFADLNQTRLYYEVMGFGSPLVLMHGFTLDARMWDDQFELFAQHHQVLRYDMRGFGRSALPTSEPYTHSADLKALLGHLGFGRAALVGLSMGGEVAIDFALVYPESVRALIPVDSTLSGYAWTEEWHASIGHTWAVAQADGILAAKRVWLNHPLFKPIQEQPKPSAHFKQIVADYSGWHFVNADPSVSLEPPAARRLEQIHAPTLVIVGERDLPDFQGIADELGLRVPGARKVVLAHVGHMANMEDPEHFNETILGFLAGV